jgi:hypothetical protein
MIIPFFLWISNKILRKVYKIWISSIEIILENEENEENEEKDFGPLLYSQKFIYPETVILDLSRPIKEDDDYFIA